nr:nudix hydrolase 9 [Ipomoea batatas]
MEKNIESHEFKLLLSCPSGISPAQMSVAFDQAYDRVLHPDPALESSISEVSIFSSLLEYFVNISTILNSIASFIATNCKMIDLSH